jgi:elongation factor Ts
LASDIQKIKQLREETAAGMMDVKRALEESNGDMDGAKRVLRERGQALAAKKSGRETSQGLIDAYIHFNGRVGVLVEVNCETDFVARTPEFREFAHNVALQVASAQPQPLAVAPEDIPAAELEEERQIVEKQVAQMDKPEDIARRIAEGRMQKWTSERALLTQPYVREPDKTVGDLLQETIQKVGENVVVRRFTRYAL